MKETFFDPVKAIHPLIQTQPHLLQPPHPFPFGNIAVGPRLF